MKKNIIISTIFILLMSFSSFVSGREVPGEREKSKAENNSQPPLKSVAEACLAASANTELNIGNVRCRINSGGDMWWDLISNARYEIPKGSKKTSMFAGALWIGGTDVNGQLKLAAQRYRAYGNDFFTGPLSIDGTASIDGETCIKYDKLNVIYRKDVDEFITWFADKASYPDYQIPKYFYTYPAHGDVTKNQSYYLAPFFDYDGDGNYNPDAGDYPYYDIENELCHDTITTLETQHGYVHGGILADQVLKGDQTIWWVFNDKGNIHSETKGAPIGLEIRAQAFAFATNDEINNMTFYSYEIINRSTYTLQETYMSLWTDPDLGGPKDDYIGCDVVRGLGYCYNGDQFDEDYQGAFGYGSQPAAVGIDFFQGPYLDPDGIDNPAFYFEDSSGVSVPQNCNEAINGVNFGDGIVDNERYGMRRFVYHNNTGVPEYMVDPTYAFEYYNFLRGIWKDFTKMLYGGNAHVSSGAYGPACDFMFPDETDPCHWGTGGIPPNGPTKWTEETAGNIPHDRRFMQSAGPFTLRPGALNYITVGLPWARATTGGPFASVELLRRTDDKCQKLFDNCFKVIDGPSAPDLTFQELDKEIIIYLSNKATSNNYLEKYEEGDPSIISPTGIKYDSIYHFEGYQIFQVSDISVSAADIYDANKARLVAQCDIKNNVSRIINYHYSEDLGAVVPREEVNGANQGIVHSFRIVEDLFATGDKKLVNNKKYYYLALAYAHNEYEKYSQDYDNQIPGVASLNGQKLAYLAGRKNISTYVAIPHIPAPEYSGTEVNSKYGSGPKITRIEGQGNGGRALELTKATREAIVANNFVANVVYENGRGPVEIKVVDPLNVKPGNFVLRFDPTSAPANKLDSAKWVLDEYDASGNIISSHYAHRPISTVTDQLFLNLGFSVSIIQGLYPGEQAHPTNGFIEGTIEFADSTKRWLTGVPDGEGPIVLNWIRAGSSKGDESSEYNDVEGDPGQYYEKILGGTWAPFKLVSCSRDNPGLKSSAVVINLQNKMSELYSVDVVFTPDKSKWSRCPVVETCDDAALSEGNASKFSLRASPSVDKDGKSGTADATYDGFATGMGWFPGYAINVETGERLNVCFGEDSWLVGENGRDMLFNPTSNFMSPMGEPLFGGKHFLYIFSHNGDAASSSPAYDEGKWAYDKIAIASTISRRHLFRGIIWCSMPMLAPNQKLLSTEVRVRIRVSRPYEVNYSTTGSEAPVNNNYPMYKFNTNDIATTINNTEVAKSALDLINVVPNPYYASSYYEENQLDNRVKITNLPSICTVSIYTVDGVLIRRFTRDDPNSTYLDWDLKNSSNIPISGGLYIIHVNAPGIGERSIKWFGSMRVIDLNSF